MGLTRFDIVFDRPEAVYNSPDTVTGRVVVVLDEDKKTEGVFIKLKGVGYVHWTEQHRVNNETRTRSYTQEEVYYQSEMCIGGRDDNGVLHPGEHHFTFAFVLPNQIPTSFEASYGHVRYTAKATIVRSWRFDHTHKEPFTVNPLVDLNLDQQNVVFFDRNPASFMPGEVVTGRVGILLDKEKKTDGVFVKFEGTGYVHWTESHKSGNQNTTRHYSMTDTYFHSEMCVGGRDNGGMLMVGEHTFPFGFTLPPQLPASFEGSYGYVRYSVKVEIKRSWRFDHDMREPFTVNPIVDLNLDRMNIMIPSTENEKTVCCMCCASDPIKVQVSLNKSGFVPGEKIAVNATFYNKSNSDLSDVHVRFYQQIAYHATSKTRHEYRELTALKTDGISAGEEKIWSGVELTVPPVPPTNLGGHCRVLSITYDVEVDVSMPCYSPNLRIRVPLNIGNVPTGFGPYAAGAVPPVMPAVPSPVAPPGMVPAAAVTPVMPAGAGWNMPPPGATPSAPAMPAGYDLLPPSYGECMFGAKDIRDAEDSEYTGGTKQYAPMYPMFNFNNAPR